MTGTRVSLAFVSGIGATVLALAVLAGVWLFARRLARQPDKPEWSTTERREWRTLIRIMRWGSVAFAVAVVVLAAVATWPYRWDYHSWRPVAGTVVDVDARLLADGDGMSQAYAVRLDDGRVYRCDDTRCAGVNVGDRLVLRCIREYEWSGTDGDRCSFVSHTPAGRP